MITTDMAADASGGRGTMGGQEAGPTPSDLRAEVRALCAEWLAAGRYSPRSDSWLRGSDLEFSYALADRGLLGITWPAPYGRGLTNVHRLAVSEELLRAGAPVSAHWIGDRQIGPAVLRYGSAELRDEILPGIASAMFVFCLGMSEPEAGSDLAAVRTTATPVERGFRLSGRKIWTSGAHRATHAYVLARSEKLESGSRHEGLTEFIVDMDSPGITVSPIMDITGEQHFNEVTFDDVFVPARRVIGEEGNGWRQVTEQLSFERGGPERVLTTYPMLAQALAAVPHERAPWLAGEAGRLTARLTVLRRLCRDVALRLDDDEVPAQQAATCKMLGNAFERDVLEFARHLVDVPEIRQRLGEALLASPGFSIRGGASEVLLSIITKQELAS